jgi:hypothetical protein
MQVLDEGVINIEDENAPSLILDRWREEGGGERYKSFLALFLSVIVPMVLLSRAIPAGPALWDIYFVSLKMLIIPFFALGMTSYAPFTLFYIVMFAYLYSANAAMQNHIKNFFVHRTRRGHEEGGPHRGRDEVTEEWVRCWKSLTTSGTKIAMNIGNMLMQGPARLLRERLDSYLGVTPPKLRQKEDQELDWYIKRQVSALNSSGIGKREPQESETYNCLRALDNSTVLHSTFGVHSILAEGEKRRNNWFETVFLQEKSPPTVKASIISDKAVEKKIAEEIEADLAGCDDQQIATVDEEESEGEEEGGGEEGDEE